MPPTLIVFSGLPGVGKTTIARLLALKTSAVYLRIDAIERGLMLGGIDKLDIKGLGYLAACRLATENLAIGNMVVSDSVNSLELTRGWWRSAAEEAQAAVLEVFVWCSNTTEHRRRVEDRRAGRTEPNLPSWDEVLTRSFEPWPPETLTVDTAITQPDIAVEMIMGRLRDR